MFIVKLLELFLLSYFGPKCKSTLKGIVCFIGVKLRFLRAKTFYSNIISPTNFKNMQKLKFEKLISSKKP